MYSVDPKATASSSSRSMYAVFPFSRQGVILAMMVSPFLNFIPPEYGRIVQSIGKDPLVGKLDISIYMASCPRRKARLGLISAMSDRVPNGSSALASII